MGVCIIKKYRQQIKPLKFFVQTSLYPLSLYTQDWIYTAVEVNILLYKRQYNCKGHILLANQ